MNNIVEIPKNQAMMAFFANSIESTARWLKTSYKDVYQQMKCEGFLEEHQSEDPVKSPIIQDIIMSNRIGAIAVELSKRLNIAPEKALQLFYESQTCAYLHDKSTGLYLYGDLYVADEFMREKEYAE